KAGLLHYGDRAPVGLPFRGPHPMYDATMTTLDDYTACLRQLHANAERLRRPFQAREAWELVSQLSISMPFLQDPPGPREVCESLYAAAVDLLNVIGTALTRPTEENRS